MSTGGCLCDAAEREDHRAEVEGVIGSAATQQTRSAILANGRGRGMRRGLPGDWSVASVVAVSPLVSVIFSPNVLLALELSPAISGEVERRGVSPARKSEPDTREARSLLVFVSSPGTVHFPMGGADVNGFALRDVAEPRDQCEGSHFSVAETCPT